jgi:hypothetical protein
MPKLKDEVSPIRLEAAEWWVEFWQLNGQRGRVGPYHKVTALHHLRTALWRPDSKPRLKRDAKNGFKSWSQSISARKGRNRSLGMSRVASQARRKR